MFFEGRKVCHYLRNRQTEGSGLHSLQILYWRFLLMAGIKILFFLGSLKILFTFVSVSSVLPLIVKAIMSQNFESYYVSPCLRVLFVATGKALLSSDGQIQPAKEDDYGEF